MTQREKVGVRGFKDLCSIVFLWLKVLALTEKWKREWKFERSKILLKIIILIYVGNMWHFRIGMSSVHKTVWLNIT